MKEVFVLLFLGVYHCLSQPSCESQGITTKEQVLDAQLYYQFPTWVSPEKGPYKTVLVRTRSGSVYRSVDTGATWVQVPLDGKIRQIISSPDDKGVILVGYEATGLWVSTDEAQTFTKVTPPGPFLTSTFRFHPRHPNWIIAITTGNCNIQNLPTCSNDLYLSQDMGLNWGLLKKYVWSASWHGLEDHDQMIIVWERRLKTGNMYAQPSTSDISRSDSFWRDNKERVVAKDVVGFLVLSNHIFFAQYGSTSLILQVSRDMGETFTVINFPGELDEYRYRILDASEGSTYVAVSHSIGANWANVYGSNAFDREFTLELQNVKCPNGVCDFGPVNGIEGIYIANVWSVVVGDRGQAPHTLISYDKGGEWGALKHPEGSPGTESLQLQGPSDSHVTYYSAQEAVGIIFSNGNVGSTVSQVVGLYFSRDAGWTWKFIENEPHIYEFGNRGAVVILVKNEVSTDLVQYSLDEGITWNTCKFGDEFEVDNIISDPDYGTRHFLMYGNRLDKGVLLSLDFSGIHERNCEGWQHPDQPPTDYEYWTPSDREGDNCLLGRTMKFVRRKQEVQCFNPADFTQVRAKNVKNCSCTDENYECDYCFVRSADGSSCIPDTEDDGCSNYDPKAPPHPCVGLWQQTQGYVRVPGDTCDPKTGLNLDPIEKTCSGNNPVPTPTPGGGGPTPEPTPAKDAGSNKGVIVVLIILFLLVGSLGVLWFLSGHNQAVRSWVERVVPERFLPELSGSASGYSPVSLGDDLDVQDDAREVSTEEEKTSSSEP